MAYSIGSLVRCRGREWVVLPSRQEDVLMLRPLGGSEAETCGIFLPLERDSIRPASFAPPDPSLAGEAVAGQLLRDAARLTLRSGAGPFRSLGRLGVRPRPYQLVPLLMALRLDPVRLLIADDVGIGKTVEAALVARELFDRGEIQRFSVLCPPHLCDQWQRELRDKFGFEAVVVRSSTAAALERALPRGDVSVFEYFPFTVASIDYVKGERRRDSFLRACPELVIVDEAHTATSAGGGAQQQRYELVRDLAAGAARHVLLLTATPHSGIEDAFTSLLRLLAPRFGDMDVARLSESERDDLARHFVQRRRGDVQRWLGDDDVTPFPVRESKEITFRLSRSPEYRKLFEDVVAFTRELVREDSSPQRHRDTEDGTNKDSVPQRLSGEYDPPQRHRDTEDGTNKDSVEHKGWRQRARYWAALALLRCVTSSPAAAERALAVRGGLQAEPSGDEGAAEDFFRSYVIDPTEQENARDLEPAQVVQQGTREAERARLRRFAERAGLLKGKGDPKFDALLPIMNELLADGFQPIVYCRYIATANYVAAELAERIKGYGKELRVLAVTGERSEEERETLIAELEHSPRRILVATDCLSEGINLQKGFDAVVHYDLPWNPNRLEQREGRVDRFGQEKKQVRTVLLYGQDNPIDEAVMKVLLRKAVRIHRTLGISVPLPIDGSTVVETLIDSLFAPTARQMSFLENPEQMQLGELLDADERVQAIEQSWDRAVDREKESRTRFAQRRIRPDEVARELDESDAVLGDAAAVERFVHEIAARLGAPLTPAPSRSAADSTTKVYNLPLGPLPAMIQERLAPLAVQRRRSAADTLMVAFGDTAPQSVEAVGRNHPVTTAFADYVLEAALVPQESTAPAARSGLIRTGAVSKRTVLLVLRVRMLIEYARSQRVGARDSAPMLAEELVVSGFTRGDGGFTWLDETDALALLATAKPSANVTRDDRTVGIVRALEQLEELAAPLDSLAAERAERLRDAHARVRSATTGGRVTVTPRTPVDVLGVYVLLPG